MSLGLIPVRSLVALLMVGVVMLLSGAPCTPERAVGNAPGPVASAPADPCATHRSTPASVCAQLACQQLAPLRSCGSSEPASMAVIAFAITETSAIGRGDAPPLPPPRLL